MNKNGLVDIPTSRVRYIWTNNRQGVDLCYAKLDCTMALPEWVTCFPRASLVALPIQRSNHSLLILSVNLVKMQQKGLGKFEAMWLMDRMTEDIIKKAWSVSIAG